MPSPVIRLTCSPRHIAHPRARHRGACTLETRVRIRAELRFVSSASDQGSAFRASFQTCNAGWHRVAGCSSGYVAEVPSRGKVTASLLLLPIVGMSALNLALAVRSYASVAPRNVHNCRSATTVKIGHYACAVNWLLLPSDERLLVEFIVQELRGALLARDITDHGTPRIVSDPVAAVGDELPSRGSRIRREFTFWMQDLGDIKTLGAAPTATDEGAGHAQTKRTTSSRIEWHDLVNLRDHQYFAFTEATGIRTAASTLGYFKARLRPSRRSPPT